MGLIQLVCVSGRRAGGGGGVGGDGVECDGAS